MKMDVGYRYLIEDKLKEKDLDLYNKLTAKKFFDQKMQIILIHFPLKPAKRRLFLKSNDRRALAGILNDHLMRASRIVGIPNIYILEYKRLRKALQHTRKYAKYYTNEDVQKKKLEAIHAQENLKSAVLSAITAKAYPGAGR